ncbi:hypothetical protein [Brevibacillus laterosporus]|uniref:hypothetical protein n=1 Tax=Brevibacillus laterosporus TaxID=1465 RepID=UPI002157C9E2|nr:hypothetical protein [Brevibacillus laterosporus]MED1665428.1 hypothetical protein [Brevibacillus laterosporus]MED1671053.1 hypothetical protein [Brevibacillus laterosporus]MED1720428.1 hypothetical protein [Brevibacillus laterosporus]
MRAFMNRWAWQDWSVFAVRIIWVVSVIILMYQNKPNFPFWIVFISLLICNIVPFVFVRGDYYKYFIAECVFAGGISLFLAYHMEITRLFPPALFTIAFYSRDKAHWISLPVSAILMCLSVSNSVSSSLTQHFLWQSLLDSLIFYGISFALQKGAESINAIKEKLSLIKEQYSILEQFIHKQMRGLS